MKIETTIECTERGVCLFSTDLTVVIGYRVDADNELRWWVDEFLIEGEHAIWSTNGTYDGRRPVSHVVPLHLAEVFNRYLKRDKIEEEIIDRLIDSGELRRDTSASKAADYHARVL